MRVPLLVIGGGLSGLAAAIRAARFFPDVLLIEKHSRLGGLNSYFYREKKLLETGLHAITNYASPDNKHAPFNKLLRQLKIKRQLVPIVEQRESAIVFKGCETLSFCNDRELLVSEIAKKFPDSLQRFLQLVRFVEEFDPFNNRPFQSARQFVMGLLQDELLVEMLFCPLLYYGSAKENDIDIDQFVIMFRAIFLEGMFRPQGSIKELLDLLENHLLELGGTIKTGCGVAKIHTGDGRVSKVTLADGKIIECDFVISTVGYLETLALLDKDNDLAREDSTLPRLGFVESIFSCDPPASGGPFVDNTIIFYNIGSRFDFRSPDRLVDYDSGVICFPANFKNLDRGDRIIARTTHLANYELWRQKAEQPAAYRDCKKDMSDRSFSNMTEILGERLQNIHCADAFTPVTIERYTSKKNGAIYGHPTKYKDGRSGTKNLFFAGTDQGFLGIVGAMLSGVSIVNQHVLPKI